jgi:hypothetical protein
MRQLKLLIAAVILVGLSALIWWVKKNPQDTASTSTPAAPKLLDVPEAQVQSIEVQKKGSPPLTLTKEKAKWTITSPQPYPADQDATVSMVSSLSGVNADSIVDEKPGDTAKYGLSDPSLTVTAHEKNGKTDRLSFGDDIPASSLVYARIGNDPKIYAVSNSLRTSFSKDANDLRDKRLLTFDATQVSRLELVSPKSDIEFGKVNQSDWQIVKPQPYRADSSQVEDILRKLADAKMDLTGKPEDVKAAETAYNTGKQVADAKVTDAGAVQTLDVRQNKDDYYAHSSLVPGTFKISADLGKLLDKPLDDFRNKKIFDFGFTDANRLEIHQGADDKTFIRTGTDWKLGSTTIDSGSLQATIDKLRDLTAASFVPTGFNSPDLAITVVSNDGKRTEKVEFSKVADGYIARRDGQPALYKLDAKPVNDILDAAKAIKPAAPTAKK